MGCLKILVEKIYGKNTVLKSRNSQVIPWSKILLKNKFPPSHFMEPEGSVPLPQQPFYLQPDKFGPLSHSFT
jgi:hypothetical protein